MPTNEMTKIKETFWRNWKFFGFKIASHRFFERNCVLYFGKWRRKENRWHHNVWFKICCKMEKLLRKLVEKK
jgi:hypothetical protein